MFWLHCIRSRPSHYDSLGILGNIRRYGYSRFFIAYGRRFENHLQGLCTTAIHIASVTDACYEFVTTTNHRHLSTCILKTNNNRQSNTLSVDRRTRELHSGLIHHKTISHHYIYITYIERLFSSIPNTYFLCVSCTLKTNISRFL